MAPDAVPYEIKRLIYDYVDLETIKSLRQASKAWASVGLELLLLPTFFVKHHAIDVQRLIDIGTSPDVSHQATKTVKKVIFQNSGWNSRYFRRIVCNRHVHRRHYEQIDFVPTQAEAVALEELDQVEGQKRKDTKSEGDAVSLVSALRVAPQANSIEIQCRNPFQNPILRKVWEEYALEAYIDDGFQKSQSVKVMSAAQTAGLEIQHFRHDQLPSSCFDEIGDQAWGSSLYETIKNLTSLELVISDHPGLFSTDESVAMHLSQFISAIPALVHLSVNFEMLEGIPLGFLPAATVDTLRSLTLSSISVHPVQLLGLLEGHASRLKRLHLRSAEIPQGHGSWKVLLEDLRNLVGNNLEKFQVSGLVRSVDGDGEQWLLWPRYDEKWNLLPEERTPRTREIEDFVLGRGPWPMVAADNLPFQLG